MAAEGRSKMVDWPRGEVLEVRRGGAEVLEVMLADAATLGLSGGLVVRGSGGASGVLALSSGAPIGAVLDDGGTLRRGEEALGPLRELLRSGATEVEVHHLPGSLVQEALAMHEGSRFVHGVDHDDVRWWETRLPSPRRSRAPRLPTMAPTVRAPDDVRDSIDRTRARLHANDVDLAPGSVRLVHAASPKAVVNMAQAWANAGGCSLMLTRRDEDVPEGVHHFWIHEGALNLPDIALGDKPLLIVGVDLHLLSVMLGPEVAASSFADVLDHGRERGAVQLLHMDESVLTTVELARFSRYGVPMGVDDVSALASDERSLRGLSGFDADAILRTRERLAPALEEAAAPEPEPEIAPEPEPVVAEAPPIPQPAPEPVVLASVEETPPPMKRGPRRAKRVRARSPAPRREARVEKFSPAHGDVPEAEWPTRHGSDSTQDLVRNARTSGDSWPAPRAVRGLGLAKVRDLPSLEPVVNKPPLARPEAWPDAPSTDAIKRRQAWDSLRLARRYAPELTPVEVPKGKGLREAAVRSQQAFDVDGAHARLFTSTEQMSAEAPAKKAPRRRRRTARKTRRLGGDDDA